MRTLMARWFAVLAVAAPACTKSPTPGRSGQSTARGEAAVVVQHDEGGILTLKGNRDVAAEDAEKKILEHCKGPFRIVSQHNVAVGAEPGGGSHPRAITEYRLTYKCASAESSPPTPTR
jgi:hypothetical protein